MKKVTRCSLQLEAVRVICTASQGADDRDVAGLRGIKEILDQVPASQIIRGRRLDDVGSSFKRQPPTRTPDLVQSSATSHGLEHNKTGGKQQECLTNCLPRKRTPARAKQIEGGLNCRCEY